MPPQAPQPNGEFVRESPLAGSVGKDKVCGEGTTNNFFTLTDAIFGGGVSKEWLKKFHCCQGLGWRVALNRKIIKPLDSANAKNSLESFEGGKVSQSARLTHEEQNGAQNAEPVQVELEELVHAKVRHRAKDVEPKHAQPLKKDRLPRQP